MSKDEPEYARLLERSSTRKASSICSTKPKLYDTISISSSETAVSAQADNLGHKPAPEPHPSSTPVQSTKYSLNNDIAQSHSTLTSKHFCFETVTT